MRKIAIFILMFAVLTATLPAFSAEKLGPGEFRQKLTEMLDRIDKSVKIVRTQITESQNAPFLPDLYLQLGELLSQRANTLYYIQMEKDGKDGVVPTSNGNAMKFSSVLRAQKEAIAVFNLVIRDFPKYEKRAKSLYFLTVSNKSIDEVPKMVETANQLFREFPDSVEAARTRLLLAQHFYELKEFAKTREYAEPVSKSNFIYEKNAAKYRLGLVYLGEEKHKEALALFEEVVTDESLKEEEDPVEVSLKSQVVKANLKREALIDSIRAYTYVYKDDTARPVEYYSRISPSELYFQEVIEKLALRYIYLKRYKLAISLLRTLTERVADPQKVLNIYQEVLTKMTTTERLQFPVEEMRAVLERHLTWALSFDVPQNIVNRSKNFFEQQVREMGTTCHDLAKTEKDPARKSEFLKRAQEFYRLYLEFFRDSAFASKMAVNLGDVYFLQKEFLKCGEYYLRTFDGEFGKVSPQVRSKLLQDSLVCLEKKTDYSFYDQIRVRGLQIRSATTYMKYDRKQANNPGLNLLLLKAKYEQGFYGESIKGLHRFMQRFRNSKYAVDAGDMILDYYHTRSDFPELLKWTDRILKTGVTDRKFVAKVKNMQKQIRLNKLQDKVEAIAVSGNASEAKSYLDAAMSLEDNSLKSVALQQALVGSKRDRDLNTFFKTAGVLANQEKNPDKRAGLIVSIANEKMRIGRFYEAAGYLDQVVNNAAYSESVRQRANEMVVNIALSLKDSFMIEHYAKKSDWRKLAPGIQQRTKKQLADMLESPVTPPATLENTILRLTGNDVIPSALYKARRGVARRNILTLCRSNPSQPACFWMALEQVDGERERFLASLVRTPKSFEGVQKVAQEVGTLTAKYQRLEGSGDPQLDMILSLRSNEVLMGLSNFLKGAAEANADLRPVLMQKATESERGAQAHLEKCRTIVSQTGALTPVNRYCQAGTRLPLRMLIRWNVKWEEAPRNSDPNGKKIHELQRTIFAEDSPDNLLRMAEEYYESGYYHHAAAASLFGVTLFPQAQEDFRAVAGCSVLKLGLFGEANYHLKSASDHKQYKSKCIAQIKELESGS